MPRIWFGLWLKLRKIHLIALAVLNCCVIETKWQFLDFDAYPLESTRTLLLFCSMLCTTISPSCVIYVAGKLQERERERERERKKLLKDEVMKVYRYILHRKKKKRKIEFEKVEAIVEIRRHALLTK
ncbi:hypothetical protein CMV_006000 [Castanea mollissima]|uniref:Uncharacterized protein n=1 Tax=Castanea mollissima TaxID=60419 RepID=A0A8J4VU02_9ROSI|nr:hypothetical protein CMV_006000 [Castanea mollissima]